MPRSSGFAESKAEVTDRIGKTASLAGLGNSLLQRLETVEEAIYQVRNRSGQDPLNFPIRLNNRLAALRRSVEDSETRPTDAASVVFQELSGRGSIGSLGRLEGIVKTELVAFNPRRGRQGRPGGAHRRPLGELSRSPAWSRPARRGSPRTCSSLAAHDGAAAVAPVVFAAATGGLLRLAHRGHQVHERPCPRSFPSTPDCRSLRRASNGPGTHRAEDPLK